MTLFYGCDNEIFPPLMTKQDRYIRLDYSTRGIQYFKSLKLIWSLLQTPSLFTGKDKCYNYMEAHISVWFSWFCRLPNETSDLGWCVILGLRSRRYRLRHYLKLQNFCRRTCRRSSASPSLKMPSRHWFPHCAHFAHILPIHCHAQQTFKMTSWNIRFPTRCAPL